MLCHRQAESHTGPSRGVLRQTHQTPPSKHFKMLRVNLLPARFRGLLSRFWLSVCLVSRVSSLCPGFPGFFLLLLGRQPENWPFTGLLPCQRLCESVSRRTIGAGTPCTDIPNKTLSCRQSRPPLWRTWDAGSEVGYIFVLQVSRVVGPYDLSIPGCASGWCLFLASLFSTLFRVSRFIMFWSFIHSNSGRKIDDRQAGRTLRPLGLYSLPRLWQCQMRRTWRRWELCTLEVLLACCVCLCHQTHPMTFTFGSLSVQSRLSWKSCWYRQDILVVATGALLDPARVNPSVYEMVGAAAGSVSLKISLVVIGAHGRKSNYANVHVGAAQIKNAAGRIGFDSLSTRKVSGEPTSLWAAWCLCLSLSRGCSSGPTRTTIRRRTRTRSAGTSSTTEPRSRRTFRLF